ncbi:MAG: alkaline phosphatase [Prolixibacteraceae bacterium]|nr:alkaline phosphatase [Prolixibacteraceae bacterium]
MIRFLNKRLGMLMLVVLFISANVFSQTYTYQPYKTNVKPVKNVIVMIPDGTSIGIVSAARWYKIYNGLGDNLHMDPYICGTVKTYSSNAPIGDSAPTTSCFMTGMPQQTGNVAIYPPADPENDLVKVDTAMAYQPLVTLLEAARIEKGKATGLVVTCEFPHATPADCSAHHYSRGNYKEIAPQMAYQNLDVMFGSGVYIVTDDMKQHFNNKGIAYSENDPDAFRNLKKPKAWALFKDSAVPYDLDRDDAEIPSLEEMTRKALDLLSQNKNGFFLMIEGSKVDWTAHANDAGGCITEFIAFDNAVGAVMEFAKKERNTAVVILPDHGNSGFTIGRRDLGSYDRASLEKLFGPVSKYRKTAEGLEKILLRLKPEEVRETIKEYTSIEITDEEYKSLLNSKNYHVEDYTKVGENRNMQAVLVDIMNQRTYFGFTTGGHTGEEVFLAAYHPKGNIPIGMNTNIEINHYLQDALGLKTKLPDLTKQVFAKHTEVFKGFDLQIDKTKDFPHLIVKKGGKTLDIPAFTSVALLDGKPFDIGSVVVYVDKTDTFYLPKKLAEKMK